MGGTRDKMFIANTAYKGAAAWLIESGDLRVTVLAYGEKTASIRYRGKEYLWQSPGSGYKFSKSGDRFEAGEWQLARSFSKG